ncbi:hypothetical protein L7F22_050650 [Adiantum nelumboides]|nr:hypothetical protein [Adiantum nelumboides]
MTILLPPAAASDLDQTALTEASPLLYCRLATLPSSCKLFLSLLLILHHSAISASSLSADGEALLAFRSIMQAPDEQLQWRPEDDSPCTWYGVKCDPGGRVIELSLSVYLHSSLSPMLGKLSELRTLNLSFTNLTGPIPPELGSLRMLQTLDLSSNGLSGAIPIEVGALSQIQSLLLYSNNLQGSIPLQLGNCSALRMLWLHDNNLTGMLPPQLGNLSSLETLRIGGNALLYGPLPPELGNCHNLTQLGAAATSISGTIPVSLGLLANLKTLSLYSTQLSGSIPPVLGNCTSLQFLFLHLNHLEGPIPPQLGKLQQLNQVLLWGNALQGPIPNEIGKCTALEVLDFSTNSLSGPVPRELGNLTSLQQLLLSVNLLNGSLPSELSNCISLVDVELDNNEFSSPVPVSIGQLKQLETLFLWRNCITGPIPPSIGGCVALVAVDLSYNQLSGPIPKELFGLQNMVKLILLANNLTGPLPPQIGNCKSLIRLRLATNAITGPLPKQLGNLKKLEFLDLFENQFEGPIPATLGNLASLQALDAHFNKLSGSIPSEFGSMSNLQQLDLGSNQITGSIPAEINRLRVLNKLVLKIGNVSSLDIALDLSWNNLSGPIPQEFGGLSQLQSLDLSHNHLSGSLVVLSSLQSLASLNVSYNSFTGYIPNTPFFRTLSPSSIIGNPGLCSASSDSCAALNNLHKSSNGATSLVICLFTSATAAVLLLIALLVVYKMRRAGKEVDLEEVDSPWPWSVTYFCKLNLSADEVLDGLVDRNIIGRGCSGLVYKVDLPGEICVAVKKLWPANKKDDLTEHDSFGSEIETLGHIRHRNIVRLLGYCTNRTERLLLYDYMPNGSLADLLFEKRGTVDWEMRYNIVLGAAHGLAYLHHDCVPAILHRDVKSNNILLDSKFQPFLADFGLAKLVEASERAKENVSKVAGSYGYIAPEYGYTLKITEKSDVYSYGVVLLEVITGRRAVDPSTSDGLHIVDWVRMMKRSHQPTLQIVDPQLRGMPDPFVQEMEQAMGVALLCVNRRPNDRPTMNDVVALLLEVKNPLEEYTKMSQPLNMRMPPPVMLSPHHYQPASSHASSHSGSVQSIFKDRVDSALPLPSKGQLMASMSG